MAPKNMIVLLLILVVAVITLFLIAILFSRPNYDHDDLYEYQEQDRYIKEYMAEKEEKKKAKKLKKEQRKNKK